jgi:hypothetical protein
MRLFTRKMTGRGMGTEGVVTVPDSPHRARLDAIAELHQGTLDVAITRAGFASTLCGTCTTGLSPAADG